MLKIALTCENATLSVDAAGLLHLRWKPGSKVSSADADAVIAAIQGVTRAGLQPMIVEIVDVCMSPEARAALLTMRFVSAVALVGATVVDRVMAAALLRDQECPHGYFTSADDAREWLGRISVPAEVEESVTRKGMPNGTPGHNPGSPPVRNHSWSWT